MGSVTTRRISRNSKIKAKENHTFATSRLPKRPRLLRPTIRPGPVDPHIIPDDDDVEVSANIHGPELHNRVLWNQRSSPIALSQSQSTSELGGNTLSLRRSSRRSSAKEVSATLVETASLPNALKARAKRSSRVSGTKNIKKLVDFANLHKLRHQIANLRLAGLDEQISLPYLSLEQRKDIDRSLAMIQSKQELHGKVSQAELSALHGAMLHVDFRQEEIELIIPVIESVTGGTTFSNIINLEARVENLMMGREKIIPKLVTALSAARQSPRHRLFQSRTNAGIEAFLQDAAAGVLSTRPEIKHVGLSPMPSKDPVTPPDSVKSILLQREQWGRRRNPKACRSFKARLVNCIEDDMIREAEWMDCAGDIATISWIDDNRFLCGATAHSDEHNMQYNKPGNLLVGSIVEKSLNSVSGHQIVRPIVTQGDNSHAAMRGTQDPWMYCSVTSAAYSHENKKCFTGSYDQTVKVWDIADDGSSLSLCGTWNHSGNVNFVIASPSHGLVATAADVREDAVRVYHFDHSDISASPYDIYEASVQRRNSNDTWAYFPATMQWGISPSASHLLLVGYSPRSFTCDDADIPDDRLNTGELCLWDSRNGNPVPITSARTQNVFEVAWHPTQPIFVAATSPTGSFEDWVKTQLRIFEQKACGSFSHVKTLDCTALDINEITIM
jgi:WD40 repeat protein